MNEQQELPRRETPGESVRSLGGLRWALWVNAALLAGLIGVVLSGRQDGGGVGGIWGGGVAVAQGQPAIAGGAGVFVVPAQFGQNMFGCYLLDVDAQTLTAYSMNGKELRLLAARTYRWDRRLTEFNSGFPTPAEVKDLVERQIRQPGGNVRGVDEPATTP